VAKTSLHTHAAVARLSGVSYGFLVSYTVDMILHQLLSCNKTFLYCHKVGYTLRCIMYHLYKTSSNVYLLFFCMISN